MANTLIYSRALRFLAMALLTLALAPLFTACGGGEDLPEEPPTAMPPPVTVPTPPPVINCSATPRPKGCI